MNPLDLSAIQSATPAARLQGRANLRAAAAPPYRKARLYGLYPDWQRRAQVQLAQVDAGDSARVTLRVVALGAAAVLVESFGSDPWSALTVDPELPVVIPGGTHQDFTVDFEGSMLGVVLDVYTDAGVSRATLSGTAATPVSGTVVVPGDNGLPYIEIEETTSGQWTSYGEGSVPSTGAAVRVDLAERTEDSAMELDADGNAVGPLQSISLRRWNVVQFQDGTETPMSWQSEETENLELFDVKWWVPSSEPDARQFVRVEPVEPYTVAVFEVLPVTDSALVALGIEHQARVEIAGQIYHLPFRASSPWS